MRCQTRSSNRAGNAARTFQSRSSSFKEGSLSFEGVVFICFVSLACEPELGSKADELPRGAFGNSTLSSRWVAAGFLQAYLTQQFEGCAAALHVCKAVACLVLPWPVVVLLVRQSPHMCFSVATVRTWPILPSRTCAVPLMFRQSEQVPRLCSIELTVATLDAFRVINKAAPPRALPSDKFPARMLKGTASAAAARKAIVFISVFC
jgi:hypothetical protein